MENYLVEMKIQRDGKTYLPDGVTTIELDDETAKHLLKNGTVSRLSDKKEKPLNSAQVIAKYEAKIEELKKLDQSHISERDKLVKQVAELEERISEALELNVENDEKITQLTEELDAKKEEVENLKKEHDAKVAELEKKVKALETPADTEKKKKN